MVNDGFIDTNGTIYTVLQGITTNVTGSWFLTLLFITMLVIALALAFRIPVEFTMLFMIPFFIVLMAFNGQFLAIGGVVLIYVGILLAKNFFFSR